MFKLIFYVPVEQAEEVKEAVFKTGAGKLGNYSHCSWQVLGQGQFKPLAGSKPFIGKANTLEVVDEFRVEILVEESLIKEALVALKQAHPYEEPAYEVIRLEKF